MKLIDTNIIVHALDDNSPKRGCAQEVLNYFIGTGEAVISLQSVMELYSALSKWSDPKGARVAAENTLTTNSFKKICADEKAISMALSLAEKYHLKRSEVFDALLAATALRNGVKTILTDNPCHFDGFGLIVETLETAKASEDF